ncbi:hypothetical protein N9L68_06135 [bacterium]|nr:hypothetical protein [bacterium]
MRTDGRDRRGPLCEEAPRHRVAKCREVAHELGGKGLPFDKVDYSTHACTAQTRNRLARHVRGQYCRPAPVPFGHLNLDVRGGKGRPISRRQAVAHREVVRL